MTRTSLATLVLTSLLALPTMAQEATAPTAPAAEPKVAPNNTVPATRPAKVQNEQEKQLSELYQKNRLLGTELVKLRADIVKNHPEVKDKIEAGRAEGNELRQKAAELFKQARELEQQAAQANAKVAERVYGELSPEYATKSQEQAELVDQIWKLKNEIAAQRGKDATPAGAGVRPRPPVKPRPQVLPAEEAKPEAKPEEAKPETKPAAEAAPEAKPAAEAAPEAKPAE